MTAPLTKPEPALYDADFYAWTQAQAARLRARAGEGGDIDWENVAEEIESVGRRERKEIRNRLGVLLKHLLKWRYQPERRSDSWTETISEQRYHISEVIIESPSLQHFPKEALDWAYGWAVRDAARETGLPPALFPRLCPYAIDDVLDPDFLPDAGQDGVPSGSRPAPR
jgi:hypothetical protein